MKLQPGASNDRRNYDSLRRSTTMWHAPLAGRVRRRTYSGAVPLTEDHIIDARERPLQS